MRMLFNTLFSICILGCFLSACGDVNDNVRSESLGGVDVGNSIDWECLDVHGDARFVISNEYTDNLYKSVQGPCEATFIAQLPEDFSAHVFAEYTAMTFVDFESTFLSRGFEKSYMFIKGAPTFVKVSSVGKQHVVDVAILSGKMLLWFHMEYRAVEIYRDFILSVHFPAHKLDTKIETR